MVSSYLDRFKGAVLADMGKQPCDAATTEDITLSGYQIVDEINLNTDYLRCLVKDQDDATQNGIYLVFSGEWIRAADMAGPSGTVNGQLIPVTGGTNQGVWQINTPNLINIDGARGGDATEIFFVPFLLNEELGNIAPQLQLGAAGADSVMFVGFDEFIYNPTALFGQDGSPFNCSYDKLVLGKANNQCKGNINYTLQQDLAPCASVRTAVMWAQWWTIASGASTDMSGLQPAINNITYNNLGSTNWSVNSVSASAALKLPGKIGGTPDDAAFLAGAQLLAARGYKIGLVPVAIGIDVDVGTPNSSQTTWRGFFSWPDTPTFSTWCTKYIAFVKHYFDTINNSGIPVDIIYIGSEMQNLSISASNGIWAVWVAALQSIADYVKAASPTTKVTYAANWAEYGNGCNFRLDSIWTYPNIDYVGIDWYPPISVTEDTSFSNLTAGLRAGEQFDWTVDTSDNTQHALATTRHVGKTGLAQSAVLPPQSQKDLHAFYYNAHYWSPNFTTNAESTPLPGYDRTYNPNGLGLMLNVPAFGLSSALPAASGLYGMYPPASTNDTWAQFAATASNTSVVLPTFTGTQYFQYINFAFKINTGSPVNNSRLFHAVDGSSNVLECKVNTGTSKVVLNVNGTSINLCTLDQNIHTVQIKIDVQNGSTITTVDGGAPTTTTTSSPLTLPSAGTMFIASTDGTNNPTQMNLYDFQLYLSVGSTSTTALTHGGEFYFDEAYCGVRTNWTPKLKPICICEVGFATMGGTAVEPNVFPTADFGSPIITIPDWIDVFSKSKYESWLALGWSPSALYGPYGSDYSYDQLGQANALAATVGWLKSLDFIARICVYAVDARPAVTMLAIYQGSLYYIDGPLYKLAQTINGKLVGGVVNPLDLP